MSVATRLSNIKTVEVSLVEKAANKRRFLLFKSEDGVLKALSESAQNAVVGALRILQDYRSELPGWLFSGLSDLVPFPEAITGGQSGEISKQDLSEEATQAVEGALRILQEYSDELPDDLLSRMAVLIEFPEVIEEPGMDGIPEGPTNEMEAIDMAADDILKNSLKDLPEGVRGQIEALWKEQNTKVQDALKKAETLEEALRKERDERRSREFIEKAKGYDRLPVKPEELAELLKSLADKAPEQFEQIEKLFSTVNEQIAESGLFDEIGSSGSNSTGGGAWAKIEAAAMGEVQKNAGITKADAVAKVLKEHPDLYNEYLTERPGK